MKQPDLDLNQKRTNRPGEGKGRRRWQAALAALLFLSAGLAWWGWPAAPARAQSPISASVDRQVISQNEQVSLTVTITGDFLSAPEPDMSGLTDFAIAARSEATQITMINGQLSTQKSFIYRLQPLSTGLLTIPPVAVEIDSQRYETAPFQVEVRTAAGQPTLPAPNAAPPPGSSPNRLQGQDFFVEAAVDNNSPYLGQQVIYTFKFYQADNFFGQPDYRPPAFTDFWTETITSQPRYPASVGGRDYIVTEIRTALFPGSLGQVTIDPGKLVIPGGLFDPDIILETEPVELEVRSLPDGAPDSFNGAVGQFSIDARFKESAATVNEPVTLIMEIAGSGNVEILTEPALPTVRNWRAFESQSYTSTESREEMVYGKRRFERLMVPGQPGDYTFPPIEFSYYDPETEAYRTVSSEPIPIRVRPGESEPPPAVVVSGPDKQAVSLISGDIRHIKAAPPTLLVAPAPLSDSPVYWSLWIAPPLLVGGVWLWQARRRRLLSNTALLRSSRARRTANTILAREAHSDGYAAAHRALLGYLSDKLNRPTAGLTTASLTALLQQSGLDPALIQRVHTILNQVDAGRFAPGADAEAQSVVAETKRLINELEKAFK